MLINTNRLLSELFLWFSFRLAYIVHVLFHNKIRLLNILAV